MGRVCISLIFLYAAYNKITEWEATVKMMAAKGMVQTSISLFLACIIEFFGALSLIFGFKTRWGAAALALFLIPVTIIFHDFWNVKGLLANDMVYQVLGNLAIFGGLLYVAVTGPGTLSLDKRT